MSQLFKLKNGTVLLSTEVPGGVYNSVQLKKIAELCSKELAVVKATEDQRLALFVKESEVQHVAQQLRSIGLGFRNYQRGLHQPVTCLGELCEDHDQPALVTSMEVTKQIENLSLDASLKIGINGCAKCCAPCHTLDISIVGEPAGYRLSMGGKNSQVPELSSFFAEGIPAKELPGLVKKIISLYRDKADPGETLSAVLDRCGVADFVSILAPYSQDAAYREDPFANGHALAESPNLDELSLAEGVSASEEPLEDEPVADMEASSEQEVALEPEAELEAAEEPIESIEEPIDEEELALNPDGEMDEIPIHGAGAAHLADDVTLDDHRSAGQTEAGLADDLPLNEDDLVVEVEDAEPESVEEELVSEQSVALEDEDVVLVSDDDLDLDVAQNVEDLTDQDVILEEESGLDTELELAREQEIEAGGPMSEVSEESMASGTESNPIRSADASELEESLPAGAAELSDEEETAFEAKLEASIAEESRLLASADTDVNSDERNEALELLEHDDTIDPDLERERSLADDTLKSLATDEDLDETDIAPEAPKKAKAGAPVRVKQAVSSGFRLASVSFESGNMRLGFESGAYVDFDLSALKDGEEKSFFIGQQRITVEQQAKGYYLEADGVRMFYPKDITAA